MRMRPDRNPPLRGGREHCCYAEGTEHLPDEGLGNIGFDKRNCPLSLEHLHHHAVLCCRFIEVFYETQRGIMTLGTETMRFSDGGLQFSLPPYFYLHI